MIPLSKEFKFEPWRYKRYRSPFSETGKPVKVTYSSKFDEKGNIVLEPVGEENVYDYIQSFAESVDINNILARYQSGDTSALNQAQGAFGDFSDVPDNWADVLNVVNAGKVNFDKMPPEFKEKFGNDFYRFVCTCDFSDFVSGGDVPPAETPVVIEKEASADES